ncbi:MAG TPA: ABC transporter ATP-binding protein [Dongiaceae bacterium]|jgi:multiple sugar transport system ATP-binding protein|nr:ABC transporter ATP-binding protein [Dongiaceae bacterium]
MSSLTIRGVTKRFGSVDVLKGIDIELESGEFLVLLGSSGCGKSTLLNIIAGLVDATSGELLIGDRDITDVHPKDRDIAMVFQSYALYPNMSVARNLTFGLEIRKVEHKARDAALKRVATLLQIEHLLERKPAQLSGGQRQRVAIGRALVREPKVFLFDEPLSNLDAKLRAEMRTEIKKLHQRLGTTIVYVTHDQIEAMTLASRIAIMRDGVVQQFAAPEEVYERPANMYVASFIGSPSMNFLRGRLEAGTSGLGVRLAEASWLPLPQAPRTAQAGQEVTLGIRPETVTLANGEGHPCLDATIDVLEPTGADTMAVASVNGHPVTARLKPGDVRQVGRPVRLAVDMSRASLFDPATELRIG